MAMFSESYEKKNDSPASITVLLLVGNNEILWNVNVDQTEHWLLGLVAQMLNLGVN